MKKTCIFLAVFIFFSALGTAFAQNFVKPEIPENYKRILQKAQTAFDRGDYSGAMILCEDARRERKNEIGWQWDVIGRVLKIPAVKKAGLVISTLLPVLKEREEQDAIEIINFYLEKKGEKFFDDSVTELYDYIERHKVYPESDFLLGKIYRIEGEYDMAMDYYERARSNSDVLDVPMQKYDILYEMADLAKVQGKNDIYEKCLKLVIAEDGLYKNGTISNAVNRVINTKRKGVDPVEYFLQFFRSDALNSMSAYFQLGDFYENLGEKKEAFTMTSLGVIVGFTHTVNILDDRLGELDFEENNLRKLEYFFSECGRERDIMSWMQKSGLWEGFFKLAQRALSMGYNNFAFSLLSKLSESCPDSYWKAAARQLIEQTDSN